MTNALMTLTTAKNGITLSEADQIFLEDGLSYDDSFQFIPTQLTIAPGGSAAFVSADGEMIPAPLTGVVIGSVIARGLWREGNKAPFCSSIGGDHGVVNPSATADDFAAVSATFHAAHPVLRLISAGEPTPAAFPCRGCPMNDFGSDKTGRGKACKEKRRLLFLPDGWAMPVILNLPVMSVRGWDTYCSTLRTKHRKPFYAVLTAFAVTKAENAMRQPFGVALPTMAGYITDPAMARAVVEVQRQFADILRTAPMEDEFAAGGNGSTPPDDEPPF